MLWSRISVLCVSLVLLEVEAQWHFRPSKSEGQQCGKVGNKQWTCQKESECPIKESLARKGRRVVCGRRSGQRIICCPGYAVPDRITTSVSARKCLEYQPSTCTKLLTSGSFDNFDSDILQLEPFPGLQSDEMPISRMRYERQEDEEEILEDNGWMDGGVNPAVGILGGERAGPGEYPHTALIGYGAATAISWKCGGTLISERYVLSAAHCSNATNFGPARWVRLGDLDLNSNTDKARPQQFQIVSTRVHHGYKEPAIYNDIVLFRLNQNVVFDDYVRPACLFAGLGDLTGFGTATGWGKTERHSGLSSTLMKVDLSFVPSKECKEKMKQVTNIRQFMPQGINEKSMVCAGNVGKDTCGGDSGGPLVLADTEEGCLSELVGITSLGPSGCMSTPIPAPYVRVAHFLSWIEPIVWPGA